MNGKIYTLTQKSLAQNEPRILKIYFKTQRHLLMKKYFCSNCYITVMEVAAVMLSLQWTVLVCNFKSLITPHGYLLVYF